VDDVGYCSNAEWVISGHTRNRFLLKYVADIQGELKNENLEEMNEHFLDHKVCGLITQQKIFACNKK
jgi:hypothetical protein